MSSDWRTEIRICKRNDCGAEFLPIASHQIYCGKPCYLRSCAPRNLIAAKAYQAKKKKFAYKGDNEFRQIAESLKVLKCQQKKCMPDCRIRGMENLGCVV